MTPSSKYFKPSELIQPSLFAHLTTCALMNIIGQYTLTCLDILRQDYGEAVRLSGRFKDPSDCWIHVNGMYNGEIYQHSGLRAVDCAEGAENSGHKNGNTFDLKCKHMDVLLNLIIENSSTYSIDRMENPEVTVFRGYLHVEFSPYAKELIVFNP